MFEAIKRLFRRKLRVTGRVIKAGRYLTRPDGEKTSVYGFGKTIKVGDELRYDMVDNREARFIVTKILRLKPDESCLYDSYIGIEFVGYAIKKG